MIRQAASPEKSSFKISADTDVLQAADYVEKFGKKVIKLVKKKNKNAIKNTNKNAKKNF